ncbi:MULTISPECIES: SRPBCC domain-containing protein [unclassified Paenibacillus]|uniref:SRPBCC domain-containing protein n=1 Tax=unclassified Paenibacillus TaxID=185978 RepID=UPI001AE1CA02|nr:MULTISPECIES: SRPBCC domain-containing protein [unclassified Paenibacillus]MBP1155081.1 uncharacterized protein YndB with AHSA1/START domain [Paenibacillus sp. PvP091]MBP1169535.1 uncharacterized protein YndB with AHSA1/START domain [Paenibacillus sp. PvR098]MBP2440563.1 uncharacterized protein YndB with AHSA1/START domain [Paenibacillus sp. PvP052]
MTTNKMISKVEDNVLVLERVFDAPRELVFKAFSEVEHLKRWFGPKGWSLSVSKFEFLEGMPETLITLTFVQHEGKTKLINHAEYASADALKTVMDMGMLEGITATWDSLEEFLEEMK